MLPGRRSRTNRAAVTSAGSFSQGMRALMSFAMIFRYCSAVATASFASVSLISAMSQNASFRFRRMRSNRAKVGASVGSRCFWANSMMAI